METKDYFEYYEELPKKVRSIINTFDDNEDLYKENERIKKSLKKINWTMDYGLCGSAYDLRPDIDNIIPPFSEKRRKLRKLWNKSPNIDWEMFLEKECLKNKHY